MHHNDIFLFKFVTMINHQPHVSSKSIVLNISGYIRADNSGTELVSPPIRDLDDSPVCISATVRSSRDMQVDAAPRLHLIVKDVPKNTELLLRRGSLPGMGADWQTLNYQVQNKLFSAVYFF